jgi:hypothetical protein
MCNKIYLMSTQTDGMMRSMFNAETARQTNRGYVFEDYCWSVCILSLLIIFPLVFLSPTFLFCFLFPTSSTPSLPATLYPPLTLPLTAPSLSLATRLGSIRLASHSSQRHSLWTSCRRTLGRWRRLPPCHPRAFLGRSLPSLRTPHCLHLGPQSPRKP